MTTFVLIHGGFHGGWCWDYLIPELEARGHSADDHAFGFGLFEKTTECAESGKERSEVVGLYGASPFRRRHRRLTSFSFLRFAAVSFRSKRSPTAIR